MTPAIRIREAGPADRDLLAAYNSAMALETEGKRLDPATITRGVERALADASRGTYLIAEREGGAVGALLLTREWSDWRDGWFWWIQSVYVAPEARGAGVYRALHEAVVERARGVGEVCGIRLYVERENAIAQSVYRAMGMTATSYDLYEWLAP